MLDDFDFKFQPSVDQRLVRELATGRFLAQAENVLLFGAPDPATYCYASLSL
jgi:DNA replication protein DnaC